MLRSFRVENHKSIKGEAELLLMPSYDKTRPVVPVAGIFGANASGKSNLLDALAWMRRAVRESFGSWEPGSGVPRSPFRLDPAARDKPSLYAVELLIDGVRHMYGFVVTDERVAEEWLYVYPHNRKRVIFEREGETWTFGSTVSRAKVDVIKDLTAPNVLFLSVAARTEIAEVLPTYRWFQESIEIVQAGADPNLRTVVAFARGSEEKRRTLASLVRAADFGVRDLRLDLRREREHLEQRERRRRRSIAEAEKIVDEHLQTLRSQGGETRSDERRLGAELDAFRATLERVAKAETDLVELVSAPDALQFVQGDHDVTLRADDQSYGTLAWLRLLVPALTVLEHGALLCIDEIDSSLHPRLTARLIELFRSTESNDRGAQLVFTTHDATLLGTSFGDDILARDEVWFVQKSEAGETTLFPLSDFHPRKDENTERRYLGGSYGAVPAVFSDTLVERFTDSKQEAANVTP